MKRSFFAPELLQISAMDCGVAALSAFLKGYGRDANYEDLRQRCQTGTDGTSIDALEEISVEFGIDACQHIVPEDDVFEFLAERLPAIAITRALGQPPHFVVVWRVIGDWVHLMDPGSGRSWIRMKELKSRLMLHTHLIRGSEWRDWYATSFIRTAAISTCSQLLPGPRAVQAAEVLSRPAEAGQLAAFHAALVMVNRLTRTSPGRGPKWNEQAFDKALAAIMQQPAAVPRAFATFAPRGEGLAVSGAVFLALFDPNRASVPVAPSAAGGPSQQSGPVRTPEGPSNIWTEVYGLLGSAGKQALAAVIVGIGASGLATALEIIVYRAASSAPHIFSTLGARLGAAVAIAAFFVLVLGLEAVIRWIQRALGRYLELRLRALTFALLPRVNDTFVRSRPASDLAYRAHGLTLGRAFPELVLGTVSSVLGLVLSSAALVWINSLFLPVLLVAMLGFWAISLFARFRMRETDAKLQVHSTRLLTIFLDALRGFRPLRLHGYQNPFRLEQAKELVRWRQTGELLARSRAAIVALDAALSSLLVGGMLYVCLRRESDLRVFVLVAFWALRLPALMTAVLRSLQAYPAARSAFVRILEISRYAKEDAAAHVSKPDATRHGVALEFESVSVVLNTSPLLVDVRLQIPSGQHVAVVGHSGSGKSSLVSLLLGFLEPNRGIIRVDGTELAGDALLALRRQTAWVDPAVQLWNRSFIENLEYAANGFDKRPLLETLDASDLLGVLESFDQGMQTAVGADGRLLSGGEGQRLRLGRALLRNEPRLVILDEPFRGLERAVRKRLAFRARLAWRRATMLFVSHDIAHALDFERVLVVEGGRIVEDGHPLELLETDSRFRILYDAERRMLEEVWGSRNWRRLRVEDGAIQDLGGGG